MYLAMTTAAMLLALINPTIGQRDSLNTPPVLYISERNWRIDENTPIGQQIARSRAEDSENDELQFGLEQHFHPNYANLDTNATTSHETLPFWIHPNEGIIYLNESLVGRGGENFFFFITVSDGQLTAKTEIFVNIIRKNFHGNGPRNNPPISNAQNNNSQLLSQIHKFRGFESINNQNLNPLSSLTPFILNSKRVVVPPSLLSNPTRSEISTASDGVGHSNQYQLSPVGDVQSFPSNRTKLVHLPNYNRTYESEAIELLDNKTLISKESFENLTSSINLTTHDDSTYMVWIQTAIIPIIVVFLCLLVAGVLMCGIMYRKRLYMSSEALKTKCKGGVVKKSPTNNTISNIADESQNSMILRDWNRPFADGNRYVPWERDQNNYHCRKHSTTIGSNSLVCSNGFPADTLNVVLEGLKKNVEKNRWEFPRHRLKFYNILGEGAFGQVWRCEAIDMNGSEGVTTVAVKTLKENSSELDRKELLSELEVMKSLAPHVNVVRFLGCCTEKDPILVIIEYVNRGKLQTYLRNSRAERHYGCTHGKANIITSADLTSFMYQVARGMEYLSSKGIIHRDLAARNILIDCDHICKIADFGFARDVLTSKVYERKSEGKLPIRWMAIESLYDNIFSVKSDIWSFGILMWEIVTLGSTPYPGISAADVMRKVRDGYRLEKPDHCRRELYNIMFYCWSKNPDDRPIFAELLQMLDKLLQTEMNYIELERFPEHNYYNIINTSVEKV